MIEKGWKASQHEMTGATLFSLAIHAALIGALILASGGSGDAGASSGRGELVWVSLVEGKGASAAPSASSLAAEPALPKPIAAPAARVAALARAQRVSRTLPSEEGPRVVPGPVSPRGATVAEAVPSDVASDEPVAVAQSIAHATPKDPPIAATGSRSVAGGEARGGRPGARRGGGRPDWPGVGFVDRPARPRRPIRPDYPAAARWRGDESTVVVEAWVDDAGDVAFSSVVQSGGDLFDASALRAVDRAAFQPASVGGRAVSSRVALRIHFALR